MKTYEIFFEIFGKKMRTKVRAVNEDQARAKVISGLHIHKVRKEGHEVSKGIDVTVEDLVNIFGGFKK